MSIYLPGFEPDAAERAQLRFVTGVLDLRQFDKILVSISGGKDSHAMLWLVRELADQLREALKEIAKFADSEYGKRIPAPSCVEFSTIKRYAEKALKGAGE